MLTTKVKKSQRKKQFNIQNTDQLLTLMNIYLSEWIHRDSMFYKEIFTYFFASLVVMILPFADIWGLRLSPTLPAWLFPIAGILMAIIFLIISCGSIVRISALSDPYQLLINKLPEECRRKTVRQLYPGFVGKLLSWRMAAVVCGFMFVALIVIGLILFHLALPLCAPCACQ